MRWRSASSEPSEAGTQVALRPEPTRENGSRRLGLRERGRLRRRVRYLRKRRELELRDLGGLIFDMYRFGSKRQDLVRDKLQEMFAADRELREFEQLLGRRPRRLDVREAGVGGACSRCQRLYSTEARFCSNCGQAVSDGSRPTIVVEPRAVAEPAPPAPEPAYEPTFEAKEGAEPQEAGGGRRSFRRRHRKQPAPQPTQAWRTEPQTQASDGPEPQPEVSEEPEPETQAWPGREPRTEPEPQIQAWPGREPRTEPEPQTQAWPEREPQTQAWPERQPQPQPQPWQRPAPAAPVAGPDGAEGGRRSLKRRLRRAPGRETRAAEEAERQRQEWEAQYQASVEAQRQAWEHEGQDSHAEAGPADQTPAWDTAPQAPPPDGESDGLQAGDPLASRSEDRRR